MSKIETYFGSAVVNEKGQIQGHTIRYCHSQCEEDAITFYGEEIWTALKRIGCRIIDIKVESNEQ